MNSLYSFLLEKNGRLEGIKIIFHLVWNPYFWNPVNRYISDCCSLTCWFTEYVVVYMASLCGLLLKLFLLFPSNSSENPLSLVCNCFLLLLLGRIFAG